MDAMILLEGDAMRRVYHEFKRTYEEENRGLTILEFISAFIQNTESGDAEKKSLIRMLVDLFEQIDVNGDRSLEWSEFMSFCVEAGLSAGVGIIQRPTFFINFDAHYVDRTTKITGIQQLLYHEPTDMVVTIETDCKIIHFYDSRLNPLRSLDTATCIRAEFRATDPTVPLRCTIIEDHQIIAVLLSNLNIAMWRVGPRTFLYAGMIKRTGLDNIPCMIHYDLTSHLLLVGLKDGTIRAYNPTSRSLVYTVKEHHDLILAIASVPHRAAFISCDVESRVYIWHTEGSVHKVSRELTGHTTAAQQLVVIPALEMVCGLCVNGEIVAWDLITGEAVMRFGHEHTRSVRDIVVLPTTPPRLLSIDDTLLLRVWELALPERGKCECIITHPLDELSGHPLRAAVFTLPRRLRKAPVQPWMAEYGHAAAGSGSFIGDLIIAAPKLYRVSTFPLETTEIPVATLYNGNLNVFVTVMPKDIFIWDPNDGQQRSTFCVATARKDITSACFDDRERKIFLGDNHGKVTAINLMNGAEMKSSDTYAGISKVVYHKHARCLVMATASGSLAVLDDEPQGHLDELRIVERAHRAAITALSLSEELSIIATGDINGRVRCWDFQDLSCIVDIQPRASPVTSILSCGAFPAVIIAFDDGELRVWSTHRNLPAQEAFAFNNVHRIPEAITVKTAGDTAATATTEVAGSKAVSASALKKPFQFDEMKEKDAVATLDSNFRLGALVDQIINERAIADFRTDLRIRGSQPRYKFSIQSQRELEPEKKAQIAASDIDIRYASIKVAATALSWLPIAPGGDRLRLMVSDEQGFVTILDLTDSVRTAELTAVAESRWPMSLPSFEARRTVKRIDPVFDFAWSIAANIADGKADGSSAAPSRARSAVGPRHRVAITDAVAPMELANFRAHHQPISCVSMFTLPMLSGDAATVVYAVTGGADGRIFVWDALSGRIQGQLGLVPYDQDLIAAGKLRRTKWILPTQAEAIAFERASAADNLLQLTTTVRKDDLTVKVEPETTGTSFFLTQTIGTDDDDSDTQKAELGHSPEKKAVTSEQLDRHLRLIELMSPTDRAKAVKELADSHCPETLKRALHGREKNGKTLQDELQAHEDLFVDQMISEDQLEKMDDKSVLQALQFDSSIVSEPEVKKGHSSLPSDAIGKTKGVVWTKDMMTALLSTQDPVGTAAAYWGTAAATVLAMAGYRYKGTTAEQDVVETARGMGWYKACPKFTETSLPAVLSCQDAQILAEALNSTSTEPSRVQSAASKRSVQLPAVEKRVARVIAKQAASKKVVLPILKTQCTPLRVRKVHELPPHLMSVTSQTSKGLCSKLDLALDAASEVTLSSDFNPSIRTQEDIHAVESLNTTLRRLSKSSNASSRPASRLWATVRTTSKIAAKFTKKAKAPKVDVDLEVPRPEAGKPMPAKLGPYETMLVLKIRGIFDSCGADEAGTCDTERLSRHPAWKDIKDNPWSSRTIGARLTLSEFFDIVFVKVQREARQILLSWTDPAVLSQLDVKARVNWREVLSDALISSFTAIFEQLDEDGSGAVSLQEIEEWDRSRKSSGENALSLDDILDIFHDFHSDPDEEITLDEFLTMMATALTSNSRVSVGTH